MLELTLNERGKLLPCFRGHFLDRIKQLLQGYGPVQFTYFVAEQIKQPAKRADIRALPVLPGQQNIA